jgi:6-phosphogluconolactonase
MPQPLIQQLRWHYFQSADVLCTTIVAALVTLANESISARGAFHIALAGGRTPKIIYERLRDVQTDWARWFIYFGDERCLSRGDNERNDTLARSAWLEQVSIPAAQIFAIPAEMGPVQGAAEYSKQLSALSEFDLVLLGLGEDGHTASLFPGQVPSSTDADAIAVHLAPKPPAERISLSAARLSAARVVWFVVTGADKRVALLRWREGEDIPAAQIVPAAGVDIFTDVDLSSG